jgi:hypothetical protein
LNFEFPQKALVLYTKNKYTIRIMEMVYDGTLEALFALLDRLWSGAVPEDRWPRRVRRLTGDAQGLLFDEEPPGTPVPLVAAAKAGDAGGPPEGAAGILARVSADACDALVRVWMSELPLEGEALRYALRVLSAAWKATSRRAAVSGPGPWYGREDARLGAAAATRDRLDGDCRIVLATAYKVAHELDRLTGFLRFSPDRRGRYLARCSPDYFVLPALAPHFTSRFGYKPWIIVDEKRGLALIGERRGETRLAPAGEEFWDPGGDSGIWEELWRRYHRIVSIEGRKNPSLQRRFIPLRYRNYLNEFGPSPGGDCN